jgi:hypothetical protein
MSVMPVRMGGDGRVVAGGERDGAGCMVVTDGGEGMGSATAPRTVRPFGSDHRARRRPIRGN